MGSIKRYSISLMIKEIQIKIRCNHKLHWQNVDNYCIGEGLEEYFYVQLVETGYNLTREQALSIFKICTILQFYNKNITKKILF